MSKKIAFVTGGNRGIGFETALGLAQKGVHVVIGSRNKEAGEKAVKELQAKGVETEAIVFDVNKESDHTSAAKFFQEKFGHLDILVNNAGVWLETPEAGNGVAPKTSNVSPKILRDTFNANFFGVVALTQTLLPVLKKAPSARIVNLSSILGSLTLHSEPGSPIYDSKVFAYDASKTALNAFTVHLAYELKGTKVKVNSAHPGWVKTAMGGESAPMEVKDGAKTSVELALLPDSGPSGGFFHMGEALPW